MSQTKPTRLIFRREKVEAFNYATEALEFYRRINRGACYVLIRKEDEGYREPAWYYIKYNGAPWVKINNPPPEYQLMAALI